MKKQNPHRHYARLKKNEQNFRRLTGVTVEKFEEIYREIEPRYESWNEGRLRQRQRQRKIGGGNSFSLSIKDRFLLLLVFYRTYSTYAFLGFLFGLDESNVGRNIKPLEPLLAGIFRIPEKKIEMEADEIEKLFFDASEQAKERPQKKQKRDYSGKKKQHTCKYQIVVVRKRKKTIRSPQKRKVRIVNITKIEHGKKHDKKIYDEHRVIKPSGIIAIGDSGYQGSELETPKKNSKNNPLSKSEKQKNHTLSSQRICVEHAIGKMKIWRIAKDKLRHSKRNHSLSIKNIAGLQNIMFA